MNKYLASLAPMAALLTKGNTVRFSFKSEMRQSFAATLLDYSMVGVMYVHPATQRARIEPWDNIDFIEELSGDDDVGRALYAARGEPLPAAS